VLPGDNANHETPEQFRRIADTASRLRLPLHILSGDHDFETGSLADFYEILGAKTLPYAAEYRGSRCLFFDLVSAGSGGPDFRVGDPQMRWMTEELKAAQPDSHRPVVFMHAYPSDPRAGGEEVAVCEPCLFLPVWSKNWNGRKNL
jgi:3',5'-cyclic-AMP phosphodiesterase